MKILQLAAARFALNLGALVAAISCTNGVSAQTAERGAGTMATIVLGALPEVPLYGYLDAFPDRAAAEVARVLRGAVAESFGKVWLFTFAEAA